MFEPQLFPECFLPIFIINFQEIMAFLCISKEKELLQYM